MATLRLKQIKNIIVLYFLWTRVLLASYRHIRARGITGTGKEVYTRVEQSIIYLLLLLPSSRVKVAKELSGLRTTLSSKLAPPRPNLRRDLALPEHGLSTEEVDAELNKLATLGEDESHAKGRGEDWKEGRVSGAVYGTRDTDEIIVKAYSKFTVSNPLHPDVFPGVRKMEAELVSMVLSMYNNPLGAGSTTSGGTESILVACKAYRDWGKRVKGIHRPEMIVAASAHAAFWKASDYFGIKLHSIPVDEKTRKIRIDLVKRAINSNTVMIVGSAPNFPDGAIDEIPALGKLALKYKIGLHVDCCLGSFVIPFLEKAGFECPEFDFRVPGVTSMSCDPHKYGFTCKGVSVLLWRDAEWRSHQFYILPDWTGGLYASPTLAGSRPGALLAAAYAVLISHGVDGYVKSTTQIMNSAMAIKHALLTSPVLSADLFVLGDPIVSVIAFSSRTLSIMKVGDKMSKRGYHLSQLGGKGGGLHIACTMLTNPEQLISALEEVVTEVKTEVPVEGEEEGQMVALYGLGQTAAGPMIIPQIARIFLETLYLA